MMKVFTIKKPKYLGAKEQANAEQQVIGLAGPERARQIRKLIGEACKGRALHIIKMGKHRLIITDPEMPEGLLCEYEGQAVIHFVHEDGAALFQRLDEETEAATA